ncbi:MAG: hypothetical protein N2749_05540 [Clostridia bacterium]|nr:hypothetical protein [Clostridia bacterium]
MKKQRGISLIVLVITIIVIIILATAVILGMSQNNPIESAGKAVFLSDVNNFKTELEIYKLKQYSDKLGSFNPDVLQADETSLTTGSEVDTEKNIYNIIISLKNVSKYAGKFEVVNGKLLYKASDAKTISWASSAGIEVRVVSDVPIVTITGPDKSVVAPGTDVKYEVKLASGNALTDFNIESKIKVINASGEELNTQPTIETQILTNTSVQKVIAITVKTDAISTDGTYRLKVLADVAKTDSKPNVETVSQLGFIIDQTPPTDPQVNLSTTDWTNQDVKVTIIYPIDAVLKEYKVNDGQWQIYTGEITISENNTTVYARAKDALANQSGQSTVTIANMDKTEPSIVYGTNGATDVTTASTSVTITDVGGSDINTLQYVWSSQNSSVPNSGWSTFINGNTITYNTAGTYYLWIKAIDGAGNIRTVTSNEFIIIEPEVVVSTVYTVHKTFSGATTGYSYNNPVIPAGFVAVNTQDAKWTNLSTDWDKGLVIQDISGNQFVWVPVDGTNVIYEKWCTSGGSYVGAIDDTMPSGFSESNITITYKGFYISRYEAGFDYNGGNIRATSKKSINKTITDWATTRNATYNGYVWNFINYPESKNYSESMAVSYGYNTSLLGTNLVAGTQWDTVLKWMQNSGTNVTDSRTWGNYVDSMTPANISGYGSLQISGYSNYWKAKNIYDMAGNLREWTNEKRTVSSLVNRGGTYASVGSIVPAAYRSNGASTISSGNLGFRVALYITSPYQQSNVAGTEAAPGTPLASNSTINGQLPSYNNPVIPAGFNAVNTTDASWNNISTDWDKGLVIQDTSGNQFVWVPVDGTNVPYSKWCTTSIAYNDAGISDDTVPSGFNVNNITTTYKGFYIARYEASFDYNLGSIRVASKKSTNTTLTDWSSTRNATYNGYLWNWINYTEAKTYSENMASSYGYNTTLVGTNLITGTQWDTVLKWIQNSGKSATNSRTWGNHNNSLSPANVSGYGSLQVSGYSNFWKAKNIYDLAGNSWEWSSEKYLTFFVYRGGDYADNGLNYPAANRFGYNSSQTNNNLSFRVVLYMK